MRLDRALLLLNLLLILVSVSAHQVAADEYSFLIVTVVVCAAVWRWASTGRPFRLNETAATLTCLVAFAALMYRGIGSATDTGFRMLDVGVTSVGDFLVVFQWVYLCREKKAGDYFWVYLVTLVHMGTAGLQMPGLGYGFFFVSYALIAVCALSVHHLESEAAGSGAQTKEIRVGARFFLRYIPATGLILILAAVLFVLIPRRTGESAVTVRLVRMGRQPVAGFTPTVHIGEMGEIQHNPQPVMHVTVRDPETGEAIQTPSLLLRGITLVDYIHNEQGWSWARSRLPHARWLQFSCEIGAKVGEHIYPNSFPGYYTAPYHQLVCDITLEPLDTAVLFAPFAPEIVKSERSLYLEANTESHVLQQSSPWRRAQISYTVYSRLFDPEPPPGPSSAGLRQPVLDWCLKLPPGLSPRIPALAQQIAPGSLSLTDYQKAERILAYLSDSLRFSYTTVMTPTQGVEPVEDFLFNLHQGHCEYFASSMVVLLREVNVPARLVNGFKAIEWNPITSAYVVRQENAHSWVEAYLRPYGWRTLDPSVLRDSATPQPVLARRMGRFLYDWTETLWVNNVLNYDATDQARIYGGLSVLSLLKGWQTLPVRLSMPSMTKENPLPSAHGLLSGVLTAAAVLACGVLAWLLGRLLLRTTRLRRARPETWFYRRMERLLARRGFRREDSQTPLEFHAGLAAQGWPAMDEVALVTERFCSARYGGRAPTPEQLREIDEALARLAAASFK